MTARTTAAAASLAVVVLALPLGGRAFGVAVTLAALVSLVALSSSLAAAGPRPVLASAAVGGVGIPLRLVLQPESGLASVPALTTAMLLSGFVLLLVSSRRSDTAIALGSTMVAGLVVGLGAGGLLLLRGAQHGFRWSLAVLLLCLAPELVAVAAQRFRPDAAGAAQAARIVGMAAVAGGLAAAASPPMTAGVAAGTLVICGLAAFAARLLEQAVRAEAADRGDAAAGIGWFGGVLLAAPATYLLATAVQS